MDQTLPGTVSTKRSVWMFKFTNKSIFLFRRQPGRPGADGNLTAASLIDAIITHQINQTASDPPTRDGHRPSFVSLR